MLQFLRPVCLVVALASASVAAAQSLDLYEGETEVADQSEAERNAGLARILAGVIARLASDPSEAAAASIDGLTAGSEEQTSELQALMRNSDAVFCLKKTNTQH